MIRAHDQYQREVLLTLARQGHTVAEEVGLPGGRVDIVRLDRDGSFAELFEVKVRAAEKAIPQLHRYRALAEAPTALLTIVVPPDLASASLMQQAADAGVRVWAHAAQTSLWWEFPHDQVVYLPHIHPASIAAASERRLEWWRGQVAA